MPIIIENIIIIIEAELCLGYSSAFDRSHADKHAAHNIES